CTVPPPRRAARAPRAAASPAARVATTQRDARQRNRDQDRVPHAPSVSPTPPVWNSLRVLFAGRRGRALGRQRERRKAVVNQQRVRFDAHVVVGHVAREAPQGVAEAAREHDAAPGGDPDEDLRDLQAEQHDQVREEEEDPQPDRRAIAWLGLVGQLAPRWIRGVTERWVLVTK